MKYLLGMLLLIVLGFGLANAQVENNGTWYVGEGLKKGDYVSYKLCHWDYDDYREFQMDIWIDGEMSLGSESRWTAQVAVTDENEQVRGSMELGKASAELFGRHGELKAYRDAFKSSILWLPSSASETAPGSLLPGEFVKDDKWTPVGIVPHTFSVSGSESIFLRGGGSLDTITLQSDVEPQNRIWVTDEFPFPIKAEVYLDRVCDSGCPIEYKFELLDHSENVTYGSFLERTSQPDAEYLSPLKQFKSGISYHETVCRHDLQLTQRHDGSPACVKPETLYELIKKDWTSNVIKAIQSRDISSDLEDVTSSYMNKIIPTIDDFKNMLSEPYDIDTIFSKFGEPHDDIGHGIHIYVYDLNDLTKIWIGYVDDIWYVKHVDADGNELEDLFVKKTEQKTTSEDDVESKKMEDVQDIENMRKSILELEFNDDVITVLISDEIYFGAMTSFEFTTIPVSSLVQAHDMLPETSMNDHIIAGSILSEIVKAGTYITQNDDKEFWYTIGGTESQIITIELQNHEYDRIVFVSENSKKWIEQINDIVLSGN